LFLATGLDALSEVHIIEGLIRPSLESMGFRLVRVSFGGGGRPTLQIMAEPLDGTPMNVDHCADISRTVSAILDVEDPIPTAYTLEVTSPGIDRPLITRDDYRRFAGFEAKLELRIAVDGRKRFQGRIHPVNDRDEVLVSDAKDTVALPFADIAKAKLVLTDELIDATQENRIPPPELETT
jgi:ribosome maturation factor RimP